MIFCLACHLVSKHFCNESTILNCNYEYEKQLVEWLDVDSFQWCLCYRASRDGWSAQDFHRHCDNKGPTMTLVKVVEYIFGGYSDEGWEGICSI